MIGPGNSKLGREIFSFSIPAGKTCPGATEHCIKHCYAMSGFFHMPSVQERYARNLKLSKRPSFVNDVVWALRQKHVRTLRVHVSGDFYSREYIRDWYEIAKRSRHITFYSYTRSWRLLDLAPDLIKLGLLPNWQMWFSEDRQTGKSPYVREIRRAYMCIDHLDELMAPDDVDLIFREDFGKGVVKKMEGVQVCPVENGVKYAFPMTCSRCGICWKEQRNGSGR
jgi:hypothetical protein